MSAFDLSRRRPRAVRPSPVFLGVLAVAVGGGALAWSGQGRTADFGVFVMVVAGWVVSLSLHEFGHAYLAFRAGDRDVEAAGYLTLNPLKYAHPVLSILLPLLFIVQGGIGLPGGAVYLHRHSFRSRAMASAAAAAGPVSNIVFGAVLLLVAGARGGIVNGFLVTDPEHVRFWGGLAFLGFLQVTAAVLNLLPIPGLDGWAIIEPYLSAETVRGAEPIKPWGLIGVYVLLQVDQLNRLFFDAVLWLYDLSGAPRLLYDIGYIAFRFWRQ